MNDYCDEPHITWMPTISCTETPKGMTKSVFVILVT